MRVPVYDNLQTGLATTNGATVRNQDVGAIGDIGARQAAQMGQVLGNAGDALGQVALQRQALVNEADVKQADIAASNAVRDLLRNPETGFLNQRGGNAVKSYDSVAQRVDEIYQKAGDGLSNDTTRRMWDDVARRRRDDAIAQIDDHTAREQFSYAAQSSDDRMRSELDGLIASLNDPKAYAQHLATYAAESVHGAGLRGIDATEKLKGDLAQAHMSVIRDRIAAGEPTVAHTYYEAHKADIPASLRADFEGPLREAVTASTALNKADEALVLFPPVITQGFDKATINEWARKQFGDDVEGYGLFRNEIDRRESEWMTSRQAQLNTAQDAVYKRLAGRGMIEVRKSLEWQTLPPDTRNRIIGNEIAARKLGADLDSPDERIRRSATQQASAAAGNIDDAELAQMRPGEIALRFGRIPGAAELLTYRKASPGKPLIEKGVLDITLEALDLKPEGGSAGDRQKAGFVRFRLESAVLAERTRLGRDLTPAEASEVISNNLFNAIDASPSPFRGSAYRL